MFAAASNPQSPPDDNCIILASASPRRRELLTSAGIGFEVEASGVDETPRAGELPRDQARRLAAEKARDVAAKARARDDHRLVLGADTLVVIDGQAIGKPVDRADARQMLHTLAARTHQVITGMCIIPPSDAAILLDVTTDVTFKALSDEEIETYLDSNEWSDKAGGYAVQGIAAYMVRHVCGSYTNVVGLPLAEAVTAIREAQKRAQASTPRATKCRKAACGGDGK